MADPNVPPAEDPDIARTCWICFETEAEDPLAEWVKPCRCRGSTKWVHHNCIKRWIDAKQLGNVRRPVFCPQCRTEYIIIFPTMSRFGNFMDVVDNMINRLSPFFIAGVLVGSIYLSAVIYGSVTLLQVVGPKKGFEILKGGDPIVILIGLPAIPAGLVLERMVNWGNVIIRLARGGYNLATAAFYYALRRPPEEHPPRRNPRLPIISYPESTTRILSGALLLPTISAVLGHFLFDFVENKFYRVTLGGYVYLAVNEILDTYLLLQRYMRRKGRRVIDYPPEMLANNQEDQQLNAEEVQ